MKVKIIDGKPVNIHKISVFECVVSDAEEPDFVAAQKLIEWQDSEVGKWVIKHSVELPVWHRHTDPEWFCYRFIVLAEMYEHDLLCYNLKWK